MLAVPVGTQKVLTAAPPAESNISKTSLSTDTKGKETEGVWGWGLNERRM